MSSRFFLFETESERKRRLDNDPMSLDDLAFRLRKRELRHLELGYANSNFLLNKRCIVYMEKLLRLYGQQLTSVSIGWRRGNTKCVPRSYIVRLIRSIADNCTKLQHLKLVLNIRLPDHVLCHLLQQQNHLITIDLQVMQVFGFSTTTTTSAAVVSPTTNHLTVATTTDPSSTTTTTTTTPTQLLPSSTTTSSEQRQQQPASSSYYHQQEHNNNNKKMRTQHQHAATTTIELDHSIITRCIIHQYHQHPRLKTLSLADCDLTDDKVLCLADFLHIRGGIAELSLRSNRKLTGYGSLKILCQAPVMHKLDLALCDLELTDAQAIAEGLTMRPWPVHEMVLAGNYRMGHLGICQFVGDYYGCCQKVVHLNMSYCCDGSKDYKIVMLLKALSGLPSNATLQEIVLRGTLVSNLVVARTLRQLLIANTSLRSIHLDDPQDPRPMNLEQLELVKSGLEENYELEYLSLDIGDRGADYKMWNDMDLWLQLNRAGRRILRSTTNKREYPGFPVSNNDDWFEVLAKAGRPDEDLTVLYWIVRHSADHF